MLEINDHRNYINVFDNISDLTHYITTRPRKPGRDNDSENNDYSFSQTHTFDEAVELLKYGDENLFNLVKKAKSEINVEKILGNAKRRQVYKNNIQGYLPNVANFLIGNPKNMIDVEKAKTSQRVINIFLNIRVDGFTSADEVTKIGVKYLSVIDILEKMGYRCNLYSGVANERDGYYSFMMVRVKTDKEPLNMKKICFTIAHPSMQRRIKFKWMEVNDFHFDYTCRGYGGYVSPSTAKKILDEKLRDNFIVWTYETEARSKTVEEIIKDLKNDGINVNFD